MAKALNILQIVPSIAATAIPEGSPSPLTWMLLLPLGLTVRRLLNH